MHPQHDTKDFRVDGCFGLSMRRLLMVLAFRADGWFKKRSRPEHAHDPGHGSGDAALKELGRVISSWLRGIDILGRWGGEEFIAVLPEADPAAAYATAERIRGLVANHLFQSVDARHLTCSIGVAAYPEHGVSRDELLGRADAAMYAAKHLGRNQAVLAGDPAVASIGDQPLHSSREEQGLLGAVDALAAVV